MKVTALHSIHKSLGGKMVEFAGYEMPVQYSGVKDEHFVVREKVGIFDVSHMGQFIFKGEQALDLLQKVTTNDVSKLVNGQAQYTCMPNENGGIVDDLIVYKIEDNHYLMVVNASNIEKDWNWIQAKNSDSVPMENISDDTSLIAVQGPKATELVQKLTDKNLSEIKYYHFTIGTVAGVPDVIISNTGYTGSGGFELYFPNEFAASLWNALLENGKDMGILPCGLAARDTLRLEKGFCLYGNDINDETSPIEAGLGWITKFEKDFTAKEIIQNHKVNGVSRKLVAFKLVEKGVPRHDYELKNASGEKIGIVTSGTSSPMLNVGIGLGYVTTENSKVGSTIYVDVRGKLLQAEVVKLPFV